MEITEQEIEEMNGVIRTDVSPVREQSAEQKANSLNLRCNEKLNRKCKPSPSEQDKILEPSAEKQWLSSKTEKTAEIKK